jgi:hypothetical protein
VQQGARCIGRHNGAAGAFTHIAKIASAKTQIKKNIVKSITINKPDLLYLFMAEPFYFSLDD